MLLRTWSKVVVRDFDTTATETPLLQILLHTTVLPGLQPGSGFGSWPSGLGV
jgi:hypothetical protein